MKKFDQYNGYYLDPNPVPWQDEHEVFSIPYEMDAELFNEVGLYPKKFDAYNNETEQIMGLFGKILNKTTPNARARGNSWSFSKVAATSGTLLRTDYLKLDFPIDDNDIEQTSRFKGKSKNLLYLQCGNQLFNIHEKLRLLGQSLPASGSSCNQTVVGAFSTGTHGSAIHGGGIVNDPNRNPHGAVHDYIWALHIILGPDRHVFLQPQTEKVLTDNFSKYFEINNPNIKIETITNDDFFNAALVSFGGFGFIHGVLLEAEDQFTLHTKRYFYGGGFEGLEAAMTNFDFTNILPALNRNHPLIKGNLLNPMPDDPYHFEVFWNPLAKPGENDAVILVMDKMKYFDDSQVNEHVYAPFQTPEFMQNVNPDLGKLASLAPAQGAQQLFSMTYGPCDWFGSIEKMNPQITTTIGPGSIVLCIAIDRADTMRAAKISEIYRTKKYNGSSIGLIWHDIRFIPQARGLLAFQRFKNNCCFEIAGMGSDPGLLEMINSFLAQLRENEINFTFHWGKYMPLDSKQTDYPGWPQNKITIIKKDDTQEITVDPYVLDSTELKRIYGSNTIKEWKKQRALLFKCNKDHLDLFTNDLMYSLGLQYEYGDEV